MPHSPHHPAGSWLLASLLAALASQRLCAEPADRWGFGLQPIVGYDDETSWTLGANTALYFNPDPTNEDQELDELDLTTTYSLRKAYNVHAEATKNFAGNDRALQAGIGYEKSVEDFYGIGADGVAYTAIDVPFDLSYSFQVFDHLHVSPRYEFHQQEIVEIDLEPGTRLEGGFEEGTTRASGVGLKVTWRTTNPGLYKRKGTLLSIGSTWYSTALLGSTTFERSGLVAQHYVPIGRESVLGFQLKAETSSGEAPRFALPSLGGHRLLRGFGSGRYVDRHCLAGQAEYRFPIWRRLGGTVFAGAGEVADRLDGFGRNVRAAGGLGLRLMVQTRQKINVRFDFALSTDEDVKKYIKLKEAF